MDVRIDTRIHEPGRCWMTGEDRVIEATFWCGKSSRRIRDASPEQGRHKRGRSQGTKGQCNAGLHGNFGRQRINESVCFVKVKYEKDQKLREVQWARKGSYRGPKNKQQIAPR